MSRARWLNVQGPNALAGLNTSSMLLGILNLQTRMHLSMLAAAARSMETQLSLPVMIESCLKRSHVATAIPGYVCMEGLVCRKSSLSQGSQLVRVFTVYSMKQTRASELCNCRNWACFSAGSDAMCLSLDTSSTLALNVGTLAPRL